LLSHLRYWNLSSLSYNVELRLSCCFFSSTEVALDKVFLACLTLSSAIFAWRYEYSILHGHLLIINRLRGKNEVKNTKIKQTNKKHLKVNRFFQNKSCMSTWYEGWNFFIVLEVWKIGKKRIFRWKNNQNWGLRSVIYTWSYITVKSKMYFLVLTHYY
jgi:hypothetical protein